MLVSKTSGLPVIKATENMAKPPYNIPIALVCITGSFFFCLYADRILPSEAVINPPKQSKNTIESLAFRLKLLNSFLKSSIVPPTPKMAARITSFFIFPFNKIALKKILKKMINENITATTPLVRMVSASYTNQ